MAMAGVGCLLATGCPVQDMVDLPDWSISGKIKADVAYSTAEVNDGTAFMWFVTRNGTADSEFDMSARDTRMTAKLGDPETDDLTGKIEVDFHDNDVLLRHAFVKMNIGGGMTLLAGQTCDVVAPLNPDTLNWIVGWGAGNIGHRSPQLRWEYKMGDGLLIQASLQDPMQTTVGFPDLHARVLFDLGEVELGASTVLGKTDYDGDDVTESLNALAVDVKAKVGDVTITGEWYVGQNLVGYMGNIRETPNAGGNAVEIGGTGLWVQVSLDLSDTGTFNGGYMFDKNTDIAELGNNRRESNSCIFANVIIDINDSTQYGIEVSRWETEFDDGVATEYDALRLQGSLIVKF